MVPLLAEHGGDAITLVQQFCDKTFPEAVEYLLTFNGRARDSPAKAVPSVKRDEVQKPFTLPPRNTDDRRVFAYLRKRGIAAQVIRQFMNRGLLYEDAEHHNCVFVGKNSAGARQNTQAAWDLRSGRQRLSRRCDRQR